jgi:hypothetical protein
MPREKRLQPAATPATATRPRAQRWIHGREPGTSQCRNEFRARIGFKLAPDVEGRVWKFRGCDGTLSYEHVLTIASNAPWNKRATKRFNISAGFNPWGSRFHRGSDNGEAEQQALACREDGVRCCLSRHHRLHAGTRH